MATPDQTDSHANANGNGNGGSLREQSLAALLRQLSEQSSKLVRQELELAKAELTEKGKQAGAGAGLLTGGAILAWFAFGTLTAAIIAALATGMATWLAALIVTVVYAAGAAALALAGKNRLAEATPPAPQTVETIKEDVQWAKTQSTSGSR